MLAHLLVCGQPLVWFGGCDEVTPRTTHDTMTSKKQKQAEKEGKNGAKKTKVSLLQKEFL